MGRAKLCSVSRTGARICTQKLTLGARTNILAGAVEILSPRLARRAQWLIGERNNLCLIQLYCRDSQYAA